MKKSIGSGRGSVYNILLKALQTGDKYGYEICKEIEEKSNGAYILKQPSLYSGLKRLEAQNLITSYWRDSDLGGRRHYYSITDAGIEKLESSNFSWEDTREDLVNSLFEKSEVENNIEDVVKQVDQLKQQAQNSIKMQDDIDEIISSTQNLIEQTEPSKDDENLELTDVEENQQKENLFSYGNSDDLFSMFNNYSNQNQAEQEEVLSPTLDNIDIFEENQEKTEKQDTQYIDEINELLEQQETNADEVQNTQQESNQLDLFSFINQQTIENDVDSEESVQSNQEEIIQEEIDALEQDKPVNNYEDILKNFTTYQEETVKENVDNVTEDDYLPENPSWDDIELADNKDEDEILNIKNLENQVINNEKTDETPILEENTYQDINNEQPEQEDVCIDTCEASNTDYLNNYRSNRANSSSFANNSKFETAEKSFFNDYFESNSFNLEDTFNFESTVQNNKEDYNDFSQISKEEPLTSIENEQKEITTEQSIDYVNIFGDLMTNNQQEENSNINEVDDFIEDNKQDEKVDTSQSQYIDDLPRVTPSQNINRTLTVDKEMIQEINEHYYEENSFEKLDNKIKQNTYQEQPEYEQYPVNQHSNTPTKTTVNTKNLPFDKKYNTVYNKFEVPDYQVRYYKKPAIDNTKTSKFISINKLNLVNNIILCVLMCILTTVALVYASINAELNSVQIAFFVISYVVAVLITTFHFLKYLANKTKKALEINKNETIYNSFFAVVVIILSVAINILFGMNVSNILNYSATFILPICYAVLLFMQPLLKKFLSKFSSFYLN